MLIMQQGRKAQNWPEILAAFKVCWMRGDKTVFVFGRFVSFNSSNHPFFSGKQK
jgi:hypothetical protein